MTKRHVFDDIAREAGADIRGTGFFIAGACKCGHGKTGMHECGCKCNSPQRNRRRQIPVSRWEIKENTEINQNTIVGKTFHAFTSG